MRSIIAPQRARATSWLTTTNVTGTGTTTQDSGYMKHDLSALPALVEPWTLEVQFDHVRTAGTGSVLTWAIAVTTHLADKATAGAFVSNAVSGRIANGTAVSLSRRVFVRPLIAQASSNVWEEKVWVYIQTEGSVADTEFEVSNIQSRLIYTPL